MIYFYSMFRNENHPTVETPITERERVYNNIEELIREAKRRYEWGGVEDDDGGLLFGEIDFTELRLQINQAINTLDDETKAEVTQLIDHLENQYKVEELTPTDLTKALRSIQSCILEKTKISKEISFIYKDLHNFIDGQIIKSDGVVRRAWGSALLNLRYEDNRDDLISLLKTLKETDDKETLEQVDKFIHLLSRK